jgi:hypothetical protein
VSSPGPGDGSGSLFDELRRGLENRADRTRDRIEERAWAPLRELAARLGERAAEARRCDDPLRDAGRILRLACDEIEALSLAAVLEEEFRAHLDDVLPLAHALPKSMELGAGDGTRRVPARAAATAVLRGGYAAGLVERLRPEALVVAAAASLPPAPADLLGEEDWEARIAGSVQGARQHLSRVLDDLAAEATEQVRRRLLAGGPFSHLRAGMRDRSSRREREEALERLRERLAEADAAARAELRRRRLSADLARRERALREVASACAEAARRLGGEASPIRRIAEGLEALASGERPLPSGPESEGAEPAALERLVERVQAALAERREALGDSSPAGEELVAGLGRLAQRATALASVAEDFLSREGPTRAGSEASAAPTPAAVELGEVAQDACRELSGELRSRVERAREGLHEAGEIVRHGIEAARAGIGGEPEADAAAAGPPDEGWVAEAAREACRRAAHRLRETASRLEEEMEATARGLEALPDRVLAAIRERLVPGAGRGAATAGLPGAGPGGLRRRVRRLARLARVYLRRAWRFVRKLLAPPVAWARRWTSIPATAPEREGVQARIPGGGAGIAGFVEKLEAGSDLSGLPANYRWLFRPEPLEDPRLLAGRERLLERLLDARRRWENTGPAAVAVVGGPGSGKASLLGCAVAEMGAEAPILRGTVSRRLGTPTEALAWLWELLSPRPDGEAGGARSVPEDAASLAMALHGRRQFVLLEKGERLFRREVGGYGGLSVLTEFIEATAGQLGWIVTFEELPWRFIRTVSALAGAFDEVIELGPLTRQELEEAVMARHRLTGYDLEFEPPETGFSGAQKARVRAAGPEEGQALLREWCFDALNGDGDRDVGEALFLWRRCLRADPGRPGVVLARSCPVPDPAPLEELDRAALFALAALAVQGDLERDAIAAAVGGAAGSAAVHLLEAARLLEPAAGPPPAPLRIRPFLHRAVVRRLREANVLPRAGGEA